MFGFITFCRWFRLLGLSFGEGRRLTENKRRIMDFAAGAFCFFLSTTGCIYWDWLLQPGLFPQRIRHRKRAVLLFQSSFRARVWKPKDTRVFFFGNPKSTSKKTCRISCPSKTGNERLFVSICRREV